MELLRPRFKYSFHVEAMEPEYVMLLTEKEVHALEGRTFLLLAPLLDGRHTVEELLEELADRVPAHELFYALQTLEQKGYLVEADGEQPRSWNAFWNGHNLAGPAVAGRLARSGVELSTVGEADLGADLLRARLAELGIAERAGGLTVVLTDDHARAALAEVNRRALEARRPWLLVKPVGAVLWLGPLFAPGYTACWECLASRLRDNRQVEAYVQRRTGRLDVVPTSRAALPVTRDLAASLAATEIARICAMGRNPRLEGRLVTLDLATLASEEHEVVRRPQCPACGDPELLRKAGPRPVVPQPRPKRFTADGGHRTESPDESHARLRKHVSPLTGIVTSLIRKDDRENGVTFSYATGHHFPMLSHDLGVLRANLRFRSGGKGASEIQARVSGISESIERYSGVFRGDEPVRRGTRRELGEDALSLRDVLLFSDEQYRNRHAWNRRCSPTHYHVVPEPFDDELPVDWTALWSLRDQRFKYLPTAYCYYGHPEGEKFFCATDANGTSAGNTLEEAILQGFFELVERDCVAQWWYNRARRPAVDLDSFGLPYLAALTEHYRTLGREVWALDLTNDFGIPCFAGVTRCTGRAVEDIIVGFGAHFDPRIALLRSLTEANQFLPALSRRAPDGSTLYAYEDPDALHWWRTATVGRESYLAPDPAAAPRRLADFARLDGDDLGADVAACVRLTAERGMDLLVLDQTRPDIGQPVVRVVVPGLRHFWRRLGPGRLYEVPVQLGWIPRAVPEAEMNPYSMFF